MLIGRQFIACVKRKIKISPVGANEDYGYTIVSIVPTGLYFYLIKIQAINCLHIASRPYRDLKSTTHPSKN
ncbi:MAG: hypothetical protein E3K36_00415 [Candidatus Brocadia sp.]|nr:hypothetical protein [Candidatus Brocadia sp.]